MLFVIRRKLTPEEAEETVKLLEQWFKDNPSRRVCRTDWFRVRKGHINEDVEAHSEIHK